MDVPSAAATMTAMRRPATLLAIGLAVAPIACVQVSDFEPVGPAASVSGLWTVDGALPTPESCAALGASVVRVVFLDGLRPVPHGSLVFACASDCMPDGETECFRTGPVVAEGSWIVRMEAISGTNTIATGPEQAIEAVPMGHVVLDPVELFTSRISARYTIAGGAPTFASCDEAGIATVEIAFVAAGGALGGEAIEPCSVGAVGVRVAPGASYTVALRALGPAGEVVRETAPETFDVEAGELVELRGGAVIDLP